MAGLLVFESFPKRRTPGVCGAMSKMFVGGCWYFLEKCWKTGGKRTRCPRQPIVDMDVDCRRPRHDENYSSLFVENSHLETRHQGVMFRSPRAFVGSTATLRYEPCTQFINVSQRALHIYFIDGCRVCPLDAQYKVKNKNSDLWASSQIAVSVLTLHGS